MSSAACSFLWPVRDDGHYRGCSGGGWFTGQAYNAADCATCFSNSTSAFRACRPRAPLLSLASLSRTKRRFCMRSWRSFRRARSAPYGSVLFTPADSAVMAEVGQTGPLFPSCVVDAAANIPLISCSSSLLAVALSITSSSTVGPPVLSEPLAEGPSVLASLVFVCCRIDTLVCSGIPGMSLSAMARSRARRMCCQHPSALWARYSSVSAYSTCQTRSFRSRHIGCRP